MTKESEFLAHQELSKGLSTRTKPPTVQSHSMNVTRWHFTYLDFDGAVKAATAEVFEPQEGEFYARGSFGCGKTCSAAVYWHPIRAALQSLVGEDRPIKSYGGMP